MLDSQTYDAIRDLPCWSGAPRDRSAAGRNHQPQLSRHRSEPSDLCGAHRPRHSGARRDAFQRAGGGPGRTRGGYLAGSDSCGQRHAGQPLRRWPHADAGGTCASRTICRASSPSCGAAITRCRGTFQGPTLIFWVFQVIRNYLNLLQAPARRIPTTWRSRSWRPETSASSRRVGPVTIVFGHNDLLAANLIDDGQRLWLIDWDYAGFNSPLFDLANLASNNELSPDLETQLLRALLWRGTGPRAPPRLRRRCNARRCCARPCGARSRASRPRSNSTMRAYAADYLRRFEQGWQQFELNHG